MSDIVELYLNRQQENEVAPMVRQAVATRRNIVFLATAAPDSGRWRLQVVSLSPATGSKIVRLLRTEHKKSEADHIAR